MDNQIKQLNQNIQTLRDMLESVVLDGETRYSELLRKIDQIGFIVDTKASGGSGGGDGTGVTTINGLTAADQTITIGSAGNDVNITSVGSTHTINVPDAGITERGVLNTTSQTVYGNKRFEIPNLSNIVTVKSGLASGYGALVVEGDTASNNMVFLQGSSSMAGTIFGVPRALASQFYCNNGPFTAGTAQAFDYTMGTAGTAAMTIKGGTQNIGIGTTNPDVNIPNGAVASGKYVKISSPSTSQGIMLRNTVDTAGLDIWTKNNNAAIYFDARFTSGSGSAMEFRYGTATSPVTMFKLNHTTHKIEHFEDAWFYERSVLNQGIGMAAASTLPTLRDGNSFEVINSGVTINFIPTTGWQDGATVTLFFTGSNTLVHNAAGAPANTSNMLLENSVNFNTSPGSNITFILSTVGGVQAWRETSRTII